MTFAEEWALTLAKIWENRDIESAVQLFERCENYRETPSAENAAAAEDGIRLLWQDVIRQSHVQVDVMVRVQADYQAAIEYRAAYYMDGILCRSSGIWIVDFVGERCTRFEQWFMPYRE